MKFEVYGALFKNKGAELMLRAISDELNTKYSKKSVVLSSNLKSILDKKGNNFLYKSFPRINKILEVIPGFILRLFNIAKNSEVKYVLDASGFSYGDQWGVEASKYSSNIIKKWKKQGKEVILMPQAFGPFTSTEIKKYFNEIYKDVKFIFVRDETSFEEIVKITNDSKKLQLAPDFTNLIKGSVPENFKHHNGIAIIPNCRMMDKLSDNKRYISILKQIIEVLLKKKGKCFFSNS